MYWSHGPTKASIAVARGSLQLNRNLPFCCWTWRSGGLHHVASQTCDTGPETTLIVETTLLDPDAAGWGSLPANCPCLIRTQLKRLECKKFCKGEDRILPLLLQKDFGWLPYGCCTPPPWLTETKSGGTLTGWSNYEGIAKLSRAPRCLSGDDKVSMSPPTSPTDWLVLKESTKIKGSISFYEMGRMPLLGFGTVNRLQ